MKTHIRPRLVAFFLVACSLTAQTFAFAAPRTAADRNATLFPVIATAATSAVIPAPADVLGFVPGDDRKLAAWSQIVDYFKRLDAASDRVRFEELGRTTEDKPFVLATISAPENLRQLERYKEIQRKLADPRTLGKSDAQRDRAARSLMRDGKTIVLITCGVHSTEVGSTLSSTLIAHRLASSNDAEVQRILRDTIILLVPSLNPDGVDIVKRWYDRTLGTPYEGTNPPELYHKYVGHDNNRDWYAFTQKETQLTVDKIHNVWHPQIVHDIHQQGASGARLFLPPYLPPVEPNVPREIVEGYTELGTSMFNALRAKGFKGLTINSTYDAWTPARAYSHYHGGVRILSETASARLATPINVKFSDLREDDQAGFDPQRASPNFPEPWQGGEWHLRDITNYMTTAAFTLMDHAATNREAWLRRFYKIGKDAVRERKPGELFGFVFNGFRFGGEKLQTTLELGGVKITDTNKGHLVKMSQPYGSFAKALLETQRYPDLRNEKGDPIQPYDVTAHSLSLLYGEEVTPVYAPFKYGRSTVGMSGADYGACVKVIDRNAVYKSHVPSMDEGWTRSVLEKERPRRCVSYSSLNDAEARAGDLRAKYDTIIIPDHSPRAILEGHASGTMPDEFTGGLGAEGVKALREFVERGGTLVTLNRASRFAIEHLKLPVRDVMANVKRTEVYVPGSILRTVLDTSHPLASGMPRESIAWVEDSPVFELSDVAQANNVRVVASYPTDRNPLLSGWLLGEERLRGRAALVEVKMGKGRVVLFGFRPQYRGQSLATYPLLFNALR